MVSVIVVCPFNCPLHTNIVSKQLGIGCHNQTSGPEWVWTE